MKIYSISGRAFDKNAFYSGNIDVEKGLQTAEMVFSTHRKASEYLLKDGYKVSHTEIEKEAVTDCYLQNHMNEKNEELTTFCFINEHTLID